MKQTAAGARILLGSIFVIFGLNGFLHFIPQPSMPEAAVSFFGALAMTGYMLPLLFAVQVVGGVLLLAGIVPLALVILAPIIVNIVAFHVFLAPGGLPLAIIVAAAALLLAYAHRDSYVSLLSRGPA
jgi:putative oxidoreductase